MSAVARTRWRGSTTPSARRPSPGRFLVVGVHGWDRGFGPLFWTLLGLQFLLYPHLALPARARSRGTRQRAELDQPLRRRGAARRLDRRARLPAVDHATRALFAPRSTPTVLRGVQARRWSVGRFSFGRGHGRAPSPASSYRAARPATLVTALCFVGSLGYACAIGYVVFAQNRRLLQARDALRVSEERYRLIAENAADLIAHRRPRGRWLYTSPSYAAPARAEDLDAGRRRLPARASRRRRAARASPCCARRPPASRASWRCASSTATGRMRQLKTRVQAVEARRRLPSALVLVSQRRHRPPRERGAPAHRRARARGHDRGDHDHRRRRHHRHGEPRLLRTSPAMRATTSSASRRSAIRNALQPPTSTTSSTPPCAATATGRAPPGAGAATARCTANGAACAR